MMLSVLNVPSINYVRRSVKTEKMTTVDHGKEWVGLENLSIPATNVSFYYEDDSRNDVSGIY